LLAALRAALPKKFLATVRCEDQSVRANGLTEILVNSADQSDHVSETEPKPACVRIPYRNATANVGQVAQHPVAVGRLSAP